MHRGVCTPFSSGGRAARDRPNAISLVRPIAPAAGPAVHFGTYRIEHRRQRQFFVEYDEVRVLTAHDLRTVRKRS